MPCPPKAATPTALLRRLIGTTWVLALLLSATDSPALDLGLKGDASAVEEYDTNLRRLPPFPDRANPSRQLRRVEPVWGQGVDGRIDFTAAEDRWDSRLNARFANRWYVTNDDLDYYNQLFSWQSKYRTERSIWKFDSQYNLDNTLTSGTGSPEIDVGDGYVFSRIPRTTRVLSPSWSYSLADDTLLILNYEYRDTDFDIKPGQAARVVDSVAHTGGLSLNRQWNERLALLAAASYSDYTLKGTARSGLGLIEVDIGGVQLPTIGILNSPAVDSSIRTTSLMAGFNFAASDTLTLGFSGGAQYNQTEAPGYTVTRSIGGVTPAPPLQQAAYSVDAITEVLTANAKQRFESSDIGFDYTRTVSPNLNGDLLAYDRYSLLGNHKFTDRISSSLSLTYSDQSSSSGTSASYLDREIFIARTSLNWQWDANWAINASYQYTQVAFPPEFRPAASERTATSHALYLNLRYLFDQHKL